MDQISIQFISMLPFTVKGVSGALCAEEDLMWFMQSQLLELDALPKDTHQTPLTNTTGTCI